MAVAAANPMAVIQVGDLAASGCLDQTAATKAHSVRTFLHTDTAESSKSGHALYEKPFANSL